jgi:hypothetical protein
MEIKAQTLTVETARRFFGEGETRITDAQGGVIRVNRGEVRLPAGEILRIEERGRCRRVYSLRTSAGRLVAAAIPLRGFCRGHGYEVATVEGERLTIERKSEGWFKSAIVALRGEETILRFERKAWRRPQLANQTGRLAPAVAAFLVHLQRRILAHEAAAAAAAAT